MDDLTFRSPRELARLLQTGELSARELLDRHLAVLEARNPLVNAVVTVDVERARAEAAALDETFVATGPVGPLHGLPMTVKDTFATSGMRTTSGAPALARHVPDGDAVAVRRLRAAGAVIYGKTNVPPYGGDLQTDNPLFGTTVNPWDRRRTPGGSSGGAAVALALGMTPLEIGSDLGGSIRTPAAWTGVFGLKPTYGIVPMRGHIPPPPGSVAEGDLAVAGPMARTAEDLGLALDVLAGPDRPRDRAWRLELPPSRVGDPSDLRVAVWTEDPDHPVAAHVSGAVRGAGHALAAAGAEVVEERPIEGLGPLVRRYMHLLYPIVLSGLPRRRFDELARAAERVAHEPDRLEDRWYRFGTTRHRDWLSANESRHRYVEAFETFFEHHDVLITPVVPVSAIPHDTEGSPHARTIEIDGTARSYLHLFSWVAPASACFLPAVSVPVGLDDEGLPTAVQVIGAYGRDRTVIAVAEMLSAILGPIGPPPVDDPTGP